MRILLVLAVLSLFKSTSFYAQNVKGLTYFEPAPDAVNREPFLQQLNEEFEKRKDQIDQLELTGKQQLVLRKAINERYLAAKTLIKSNDIVIEGRLFDSINRVFEQLVKANPAIHQESKLVLYKDRNFNAFTLGDNIVFVNIGLIARAGNYEELTLVLAHELAHNTLDHVFISMIESTKIKTDKELNNAIEKINDQEYNQVTALNELLVPVVFAQKEMSRRHEFEADSLGLVYYKNLNWDIERSLSLYAVMKNAEHLYDPSPIDFVAVFGFDGQSSFNQRYSRYSNSSSLGTFSAEKKEYESYLRSHPYEEDRIKALLRQTNLSSFDTVQTIDSIYARLSYSIFGEMVHSALNDGDFSDAVYFALRMLQKFPGDAYANAALSYVFSQLAILKQMRMTGKFIGIQNPENDETIDRLYFALQILKPEECLEIGRRYRNNVPISYTHLLVDFSDLNNALAARNFEEYTTRKISLDVLVQKTPFATYLRLTNERFEQLNSTIKNK